MTDTELKNRIYAELVSIWETNIKEDYDGGWLLKEDTLKNALYFHLRSRLGKLFKENDVRIFTEFTDAEFKGSKKRPDLVIAKVDMERQCGYWGEAVTDCLAVVEIKFKTGFSDAERIYADYEKLRHYIETLKVTGDLYMVTIWEQEDFPTNWIRKNAAWAKGRLVELNASYKRNSEGELQFYPFPH